ncbi:MAG: hypothetical protein IPN01_31135 [Deltaproteobacteria bacterium]|nr:hypothetical protein [Deltaproteobacteria bacterium]
MAEPLVAPVTDDPDRWRRRAISISGVLLASWALAAAALPLLLVEPAAGAGAPQAATWGLVDVRRVLGL